MGYLFIVFALMAGVTKGYLGKRTSGIVGGFYTSVFSNGYRMLACVFFGFFFSLLTGAALSDFSVSATALFIIAVTGVCNGIFVSTWLVCVKAGAYMFVDVFVTLAVLIPSVLSMVFFDQPILPLQYVGMALLVGASLLMAKYNSSIKSAFGIKSLLLLVLCGASSGLVSFMQVCITHFAPECNKAVYNFYSYIFSFLFLGLLLCVMTFRRGGEEQSGVRAHLGEIRALPKRLYLIVGVMAVALFLNSYFLTAATGYLPSAIVHPLAQGIALCLGALMSHFLFGEKMSRTSACGVALTLVALFLINFYQFFPNL